jgi:ribonucleoside-diphosphate reductase alpha chain
VVGAPYVKAEPLPVFDCAVGERAIHYGGHVKMMGAVQPFISGAISKTGEPAGGGAIEDVMGSTVDAWKLGVKAIAIYRDNCKVAQPLSSSGKDGQTDRRHAAGARARAKRLPLDRTEDRPQVPGRRPRGLHPRRPYDDGSPGDIFVDIARTDDDGRPHELALPRRLDGPPVRRAAGGYVSKLSHQRFEPSGLTNDADIRAAKSIVDYIFRWFGKTFLTPEQQEEAGSSRPR